MTLITECIPCQYGDHDHHHRVVQAVPEGVMGGAICVCEGECRDREQPAPRVGPPLDTSAVDALAALARGDDPGAPLNQTPERRTDGRSE